MWLRPWGLLDGWDNVEFWWLATASGMSCTVSLLLLYPRDVFGMVSGNLPPLFSISSPRPVLSAKSGLWNIYALVLACAFIFVIKSSENKCLADKRSANGNYMWVLSDCRNPALYLWKMQRKDSGADFAVGRGGFSVAALLHSGITAR